MSAVGAPPPMSAPKIARRADLSDAQLNLVQVLIAAQRAASQPPAPVAP
jgi:hypothetical protein